MRTLDEILASIRQQAQLAVETDKVMKIEDVGLLIADPTLIRLLEGACREVCVYGGIRVLTPLQPST